jgi:hypothetical protein
MHTQTLHVQETLFLRVRTSAAGRLLAAPPNHSHTHTHTHYFADATSLVILSQCLLRLRCMDDKISWLGGLASQWRPPQARCMHCRIVRLFGRR